MGLSGRPDATGSLRAVTIPVDPAPPTEPVRCAAFHESLDVPPWGSAPSYEGFLFVEVPGPWPHDVTESGVLAEVVAAVSAGDGGAAGPVAMVVAPDGRRWRPQAVVPRDGASDVEVLAFDRPAGVAQPYRRRAWRVAPDAVVALCRAVLDAAWFGDVVVEGAALLDDAAGTELFVCTHGRRDTCCGASGTRLAETLAADAGLGARVRRTSHLGGHKFAPTVLSMPDGYSWAHVPADAGRSLGAGGKEVAAAHCRGTSALDHPAAQVLDVKVLGLFGAVWATSQRLATVTDVDDRTARVEIVCWVDGLWYLTAWGTAVVERLVPQPACAAEDPGTATAPVWRLTGFGIEGDTAPFPMPVLPTPAQ